jgi:vacuolar-type H+-ATPase subunit H
MSTTPDHIQGDAMDQSGGTTERSGGPAARGIQEAETEAKQVVAQAKSEAENVVDGAKEQAGEVAHEVRSQAGNLAGDARDRLREQADEQADRVAASLRTVSSDLASISECGEHGDGAVASVSRELANGVDRLAGRVESGGIDGLLDDTRRYARRNPGQFLLGAAALGFLAGRFFRNVDMAAIKDGMSDEGDGGSTMRPAADITRVEPIPETTPAASAVDGGMSTTPIPAGGPTTLPGANAPTSSPGFGR